MPFYEYKPVSGACPICHGRFQDLQKISDPPHTRCPDCQRPCERVFSVPLISVKGSAFRASEKAEIQKFNQGLFDQKQTKSRALSPEGERPQIADSDIHSHHDCVAVGCFSSRSEEEVQRLVDQSESKRKPYMIKSEKK